MDLAIGGDGFVEWLSMEMVLWMWSLVDLVLVVRSTKDVFVDKAIGGDGFVNVVE